MKKILFVVLMLLSVVFAEKMAIYKNAIYIDMSDDIGAEEWNVKQMAVYVVGSALGEKDLNVTFHANGEDYMFLKSGGKSAWSEDWLSLEAMRQFVNKAGEMGYDTACSRLALQYIDVLD